MRRHPPRQRKRHPSSQSCTDDQAAMTTATAAATSATAPAPPAVTASRPLATVDSLPQATTRCIVAVNEPLARPAPGQCRSRCRHHGRSLPHCMCARNCRVIVLVARSPRDRPCRPIGYGPLPPMAPRRPKPGQRTHRPERRLPEIASEAAIRVNCMNHRHDQRYTDTDCGIGWFW